jgi:primase-polymerase (primpol)-like protein
MGGISHRPVWAQVFWKEHRSPASNGEGPDKFFSWRGEAMNQPEERQSRFEPEAIPQEMKEFKQWVCWRSEDLDNGKTTKIPLDPNKLTRSPVFGHIKAQSNNPETWADFDTATMAAEKHNLGLGFILTKDDPFTGIDIDNCLNGGVPDKEASRLLNDFGSYAEVTPSGKGLHIITKAKLAAGGQKSGNLEIYDNLRFLTMTGAVVNGKTTIKEGQTTIDRIYKKQPLRLVEKPLCDAPRSLVTQSKKTDEQILKELENHDSVRYEMLFRDCDLRWYDGDHSKADMAFCSMLAMFTQDRSQIDRIFRQSALYREKWDVKHHGDGRTYGEGILDAVFQNIRPVPMVKDIPQDDGIELTGIKDLLEKKFPSINYIISGGILPEGGLLFLAGESGVGKSMLSMEICLHLAIGRQLFDGAFMVPKPRRILISV